MQTLLFPGRFSASAIVRPRVTW